MNQLQPNTLFSLTFQICKCKGEIEIYDNYLKSVQLFWLMSLTTSAMLLVELGLPIQPFTVFILTFHNGVSHVPLRSFNVFFQKCYLNLKLELERPLNLDSIDESL